MFQQVLGLFPGRPEFVVVRSRFGAQTRLVSLIVTQAFDLAAHGAEGGHGQRAGIGAAANDVVLCDFSFDPLVDYRNTVFLFTEVGLVDKAQHHAACGFRGLFATRAVTFLLEQGPG
ncbi:hypothetical protein D3C76_1460030 [compost metagenome]